MDHCWFKIPLLPPSVNHYVEHPAAGVHRKSAAAKAWERDFPLFAGSLYCVSPSGRFHVTLEFTPGPGSKGDVDNYNKLPLDCCAKRGMFRNAKNEPVSDAWVKWLEVKIHDLPGEREHGPQTKITIEAM